ncbi:MAG: ribosome-binding factor A [bacterium]|nr:ribosome-binding factor A [bacterium]
MKQYHNPKLASLVQEILTSILIRDFNFGGALVTVLDVQVSENNLKANVRLGIIPREKELEVFKVLREHEREIRHKLLRKTRLRLIPRLIFEIAQGGGETQDEVK